MIDEVIKSLESKRLTIVEVEIDANKEVDKAIKCWNFIKTSIQSKFGKILISPSIVQDLEDLECIDLALVWETEDSYFSIRVIEDRRESVFIYYQNNSTKEKLEKWYQIEDELPDWLTNKLLLFVE